MFGIGWTEFLFIAVILLVFIGPKHLPGMMRKAGRIVGELRMASRELRNQIDMEVHDLQETTRDIRNAGQEVVDHVSSPYDDILKEEQEIRELVESKSSKPMADADLAEPADAVDAEAPDIEGVEPAPDQTKSDPDDRPDVTGPAGNTGSDRS